VHLRLRLWVAARPGVDREPLAAHIARVLRAWQPSGGPTRGAWALGLAEIADHVAAMEAVEGVARAVFLDASLHEARLGTDAAAIGVQIGLHSTVGRDSRLGGEPPVTGKRLLRDQGGELVAIAFEPWELPRLDVHPADIRWVDTAAYRGQVR
jgi:hypothetical protein